MRCIERTIFQKMRLCIHAAAMFVQQSALRRKLLCCENLLAAEERWQPTAVAVGGAVWPPAGRARLRMARPLLPPPSPTCSP